MSLARPSPRRNRPELRLKIDLSAKFSSALPAHVVSGGSKDPPLRKGYIDPLPHVLEVAFHFILAFTGSLRLLRFFHGKAGAANATTRPRFHQVRPESGAGTSFYRPHITK